MKLPIRLLASAALAAAAAVIAGPAAACQYDPPEEVGYTSAEFLARRMVAAATYVDLVLVEDDGMRSIGEPATGILTLRSIARLKGNSADRFSLFGSAREMDRVAPLEHHTLPDGRVRPLPHSEERLGELFPALDLPPSPSPPLNSCSPPPIAGQTGRFYVVMRGADGRLLQRLQLYPDIASSAFGFVPVTLDEDDYWLGVVHAADERGEAPAASRVLHLRSGSDPAQVEAALKRAGVTASAAFVRRGDWWDEVRPNGTEAAGPWLRNAVPFVAARGRGAIGEPDWSGAEFLRPRLARTEPFGGMGYKVAQAFTASVRRSQRAAAAEPVLAAIELSGPADAVAALAGESFADGFRPLPARDNEGSALVLPGDTDAERFEAMQALDRDIWLLNGGNGNRQGTLPQ